MFARSLYFARYATCNEYYKRMAPILSKKLNFCSETSEANVDNGDTSIKYQSLFDRMPSAIVDEDVHDVYYPTNFGSIRFDTDNPPKNFSMKSDNDSSISESTLYEDNLELDVNTSRPNIDYERKYSHIYNSADVSTDGLNCTDNSSFGENILNSESVTNCSDTPQNEYFSGSENSLNYIDNQYFNNSVYGKYDPRIELQLSSIQKSDTLSDDVSNSHSSKSTLNGDRTPLLPFNIVKTEVYSFAQAIREDFDEPPKIQILSSDYSETKETIQSKLLQIADNIKLEEQNIRASQPAITTGKQKIQLEEKVSKVQKEEGIENAFEYVVKKRKEAAKKIPTEELHSLEKYKRIINEIPPLNTFLQYDCVQFLKSSVIYSNYDIVSIFKPYGISSHDGGEDKYGKRCHYCITDLLPDLARALKADKLYPIHRLDVNTTGVMLLARTEEVADTLKKLFKEHQIRKSYLAITRGIPSPLNGIIDIPVAEGRIGTNIRMVLRPDIDGFRGKFGTSLQAITKYMVVSKANDCALVNLEPLTGVKHQLRVHLGFGLNCPVLGDHKYSHLKEMLPQKLPGAMLDHLQIKQTRVRDLPTFLHCHSLTIPEIANKGIHIKAGPPKFFRTAVKCLQLNQSRNRVTDKFPELIFE